jgi:predicted nucleic acid-binding protein
MSEITVKISEALTNIQWLGFDTVSLIYFIERHPSYFSKMLEIMRSLDKGFIHGIGSSIVLTEVLVQPVRNDDISLAERYESVLLDSNYFHLQHVTVNIARRAAHLRAQYNLKIPDALHVATAIETGCQAFLTNDRSIQRVQGLRVLVLDDLENT